MFEHRGYIATIQATSISAVFNSVVRDAVQTANAAATHAARFAAEDAATDTAQNSTASSATSPANTLDKGTNLGQPSFVEDPNVARCSFEFTRAFKASRANNKSEYESHKDAKVAFCNALPPLSGHANIRNFIACVAHGLLIGAIDESVSSRLFYAAQVASSHASVEAKANQMTAVRAKSRKTHTPPSPRKIIPLTKGNDSDNIATDRS